MCRIEQQCWQIIILSCAPGLIYYNLGVQQAERVCDRATHRLRKGRDGMSDTHDERRPDTSVQARRDGPMTGTKVWLITGAGRGMGVYFATAALAAGHAVVATGRNPDAVSQAVGEAENLLAVKLDVTSPTDAEAAVAGRRRSVRSHRRAGQQRGHLLWGLLRGADARADRAPAGDEPAWPDARHPRRAAHHAPAALRPHHGDLIGRGPVRL